MRVTNLDPISLKDVRDIDNAPYIIDSDLKLFFESEANKLKYIHLALPESEQTETLTTSFVEEYEEKLTGTFN